MEAHDHPHPDVMAKLDEHRFNNIYRTDKHYHLTFTTDGKKVWTKCSEFSPAKEGG